jgi:hypothetical protein
LEILSTRKGFKSAVRYINKTLGLIDALEEGANLGDLLLETEDEELRGEIAALFRMVLVDKLGYAAFSFNLSRDVSEPASLAGEFERWGALDLVAAYHHPDMGLLAANPKNAEGLSAFGPLRKHELLVIYAGRAGGRTDDFCLKAAKTAAALFDGAEPGIPPELYGGLRGTESAQGTNAVSGGGSSPRTGLSVKIPAAVGASAAPVSEPPPRRAVGAGAGPPAKPHPRKAVQVPRTEFSFQAPRFSRMTPMYSVVVQNELFHNGNVEAWKRIIDSYNTKYPDLRVFIYYDGERILNINTLFKWGKVKHGRSIQFTVAGDEIKDVAKLQRYLVQGASPHFEAFLRGPVSGSLRLF